MEQQNIEKKDGVLINKYFLGEYVWLISKSPTANLVLLFIVQHMDLDNHFTCTYTFIKDKLEISTQTISKAIKLLEDNGFIHRFKTRKFTSYTVNPQFALYPQALNKKFDLYSSFKNIYTLHTRENIKSL